MSIRGRILIVDEDDLVRQALSDVLKEDGHFVRAVAAGSEACDLLIEPYDLLLLHRRLTHENCDALVRLAREQHTHPSIVLMSSEKDHEVERNGLRLGAAEIVYKPISPGDLRSLVQRHLEQAPPDWDLEGAPRILIVDDQDLLLLALRDTLEDRYTVVECTTSASEALEWLRERPFEILLTDLMMEEMSGIELIRAAKNIRPHLQAVLMTGFASKDAAISALKEGASDFLEKPFKPEIVLQTVARTWRMVRYEIENRRLLRALQESNGELRIARDDAEAASRLKGQLLTNLSHEFRTPLNGILGSLNVLQGGKLAPEHQPFIEIAQKSGRNLLTLLDNFLCLAEVEAGRPQFWFNSFDPARILREVVESAREHPNAEGLQLEWHAHHLPTKLQGAEARVKQILSLLVDNALKFTDAGTVRVDAFREEGKRADRIEVRFVVQDTGIGLDSDLEVDLFAPFTQVDSSVSRRYDGTGLGLAICKKLVEYLDGEIGYHSQLGEGSEFWFVLPFTLEV